MNNTALLNGCIHIKNAAQTRSASWLRHIPLLAFSAVLATGCSGRGDGISAGSTPTPAPTSAPVPSPIGTGIHFNHMVSVVLENTDYATAMSDAYLKSLTSRGTLFGNFTAVTHPSYPNYVAMIAGNNYGIADDAQITLDVRTVADLLEAKNLSWKSYAEDYPGNCFLGDFSGLYARKHEPFLSIKSIQTSSARCAKIVDAAAFQSDWQNRRLANYSIYVPNVDNDGHDTGVAYASAWLKQFLEPLLADQAGMNGTVFEVTFDESAGGSSNQIYTLLIGPSIKPGYTETSSRGIYDMLRMVEDNFGLGNLGQGDARATALSSIWTGSTPPPS